MEEKIFQEELSDRGRIVTILLCIFGGFSGLHRLYTGHVLLALLYSLTGGVLLIGVVLDLLTLIFSDYKDVSGKSLN